MANSSIDRRDFLKLFGLGTSAVGANLLAPRIIAKTPNGILVESESEYGGFQVEKLNGKKYPYQYDPDKIKKMSEKSTTFSRNTWDPDRQERPETKENITEINLFEGTIVIKQGK